MENNEANSSSNCNGKVSDSSESGRIEDVSVDREEDRDTGGGELSPLLSPKRGGIAKIPKRGGIAKNPKKSRQKVQWNDRTGKKLVEVLEFQPSDTSDTDDDELDSCICTIL